MKQNAGSGGLAPSLASNSRWNLVAFAFGLAGNFVTIPFVIRWIGMDAFGLAALVLAICAPMTLIGTVLGQALIREISSRESSGEKDIAGGFIHAAVRLCLLAALACWTLLILSGPWITQGMLDGGPSSGVLHLAFLLAATGGVAQQLALVFQGASAARQDYRTIAKVTAISTLAVVGATLGFSWLERSPIGYLLGIATGFLLTMITWLVTLRRDTHWRGFFAANRKAETAALVQFGKWQGIAQLAGALGNQIDRYVLGALAPIAVVGQYTVANRLQEAAYVGVVKAGEVLFPRFGSMSNQSVAQRQLFFQTSSWVMSVLTAAMLAPLALLANGILTVWVGAEAANGSDQILIVLVLGGMVGSASNVFVYYAMGIGRNAPVAGISVLYSVLTVLMTILLIAYVGPQAAGAGLLVASVFRVVASLHLTRKLFFPTLTWAELLVSTVLPVLVGTACVLGGYYTSWARPDDWFTLLPLYAVLAGAIMVVNVMASAATRTGRGILTQMARALQRR